MGGQGEALLRELVAALRAHPRLDEIGLIVSDVPEVVVAEGTKLGLTLPAACLVCEAAHRQWLALRSQHRQPQQLQHAKGCPRAPVDETPSPDPSRLGGLVAATATATAACATTVTSPAACPACALDGCTRALVVVNANCYSAWHDRKRLVRAGAVSIPSELRFATLVFTKHPKSPDGWAHRRWLLGEARARAGQATGAVRSLVATELAVCQAVSEAYPKNYYSWTHRQWAITALCTDPQFARPHTLDRKASGPATVCAEVAGLLERERDQALSWVDTHISDHCGYHHLTVCLAMLAELQLAADPTSSSSCSSTDTLPDCLAAYAEAAAHVVGLTVRYPGHEAMWCCLRTLTAARAGLAARYQHHREQHALPELVWPSPLHPDNARLHLAFGAWVHEHLHASGENAAPGALSEHALSTWL